jgi:TonB-linked SusC/RagA family outer membrane protein
MRRFFYSVLTTCAFVALPALAAAQATITGRVTSEDGQPLPNASVVIQGTSLGAITRADGDYSLAVPASRTTGQTATLSARRLGYAAASVTITLVPGDIRQDFSLVAAPVQLTGVVTTALGFEREKSKLGTAQQQLSGEELNQTRAPNILEQLAGKAAGVQITSSGTPGGSPRITIRGANSITGNNSPLIVVDGVAMSTAGRGGHPMGGTTQAFDFGSAINDVNPDDIETMSILKGPNAAALYGSRAANGVILITTKKGTASQGRVRTEISTSYTWERPSILPTFQNLYGQGAEGQFLYIDGAGGGVNDNLDQSFGPRLDGRTTGCVFVNRDPDTGVYDTSVPCRQFNAPNGAPWIARPDNVEGFFETGGTVATTVAVSGGTERVAARLSVGQDYTESYIPNNDFRRTTALLNGTVNVGSRVTADATLNYIRNNGRNRPGVGYSSGIASAMFVWFGRQVDVDALRNYQLGGPSNGGPSNREFNWNYNYHNNPFWLQYENPVKDTRDRFMGTAALSYQVLDWLKATARIGTDIYRFDIDQNVGQGNLYQPWTDQEFFGGFRNVNDYRNDRTTEAHLTADRMLIDRLQVNATVGASLRQETFKNDEVRTGGISVPGIYNVSNAAITPTLVQEKRRREVQSVLGSAAFTWDGWLTIEGSGRNDWSSTLPRGNNSYFYPAVAASVILTDIVPGLRNNSILSYAKLRAATARVGADTDPYALRTTYVGNSNKFDGLPQFSLADTLANPDLRPEITRSHEVGAELAFLDERITLDASFYDKSTKDQIFAIDVSPASGFRRKQINAGRVTNRGIEALLSVTPLKNLRGLEWTSTFNFARNRSRVAELDEGVTTIVLGSGWYVNVEARLGEPYGSLFGYSFERDEATGKLLTSDGLTLPGPRKVLGNIQPDWTGSWSNTFRYKNFTLYGLVDVKKGGDIYSITNFFGDYAGVLESSLRGREVDWDKPGLIVDGIDVDTGEPNTVRVTAERYFQNIFPVNEPYVYDGSFVKLREIRLGFDLPQAWANRMYADAVNIAVTGRNLHTWTDVPNIDPEFSYTTDNLQGIEYTVLPNARTFGLSVRLTP